jgi:hypothetical protein
MLIIFTFFFLPKFQAKNQFQTIYFYRWFTGLSFLFAFSTELLLENLVFVSIFNGFISFLPLIYRTKFSVFHTAVTLNKLRTGRFLPAFNVTAQQKLKNKAKNILPTTSFLFTWTRNILLLERWLVLFVIYCLFILSSHVIT